MYIKNTSNRVVDVPEALERKMSSRLDVDILSVSEGFWVRYPELVEKLKSRNENLVMDGNLDISKIPGVVFPSHKPAEARGESIGKNADEIEVEEGKIHLVIYPNYLPKVGGIETAIYELAKALDKDKYFITIAFYNYESEESMRRYAQVANLVQLNGKELNCDVCLMASNFLKPVEIKAKKWLQWIHSDYEKYNDLQLVDNQGIDAYVAVSGHVAKICKKMFNIDCRVIHNILSPDFSKGKQKPIKLVSNTRISPEKGFDFEHDRMLKFARLLKESGRSFSWIICGDNTHMKEYEQKVKEKFKEIQEVSFIGYKTDVLPTLLGSDYFVLLSDFEGCPYGVLEALQVNIPCIVSNWGGVEELIEDGVNGYILPMDLEGVDINKILDNIPKFKYKEKSGIKAWDNLISN